MKKYIIVLCIVFAYIGITLLVSNGIKQEKTEKFEYIVFDDNTIWKFNNKKMINVLEKQNVLANKKFFVYTDGNYFGKYNIGNYENDIYLLDDDNNSIKYNGIIFASTQSKKLKLLNMNDKQMIEDKDITFLKNLLKDDTININQNNLKKYLFDIDNDGIIEEICSFSNMFSEENVENRISIIYVIDNDKSKTIIMNKQTKKNSFGNGYEYSINQIGDINNDGNIDIVLMKSDYGSPKIERLFFKNEKGKYSLINS